MSTSFGFLSSYPPTQCGLATFTAALHAQVAAAGHEAGVVRVVEQSQSSGDAAVVDQMVHDQPDAAVDAAAALNSFDVVVVQHEFGIYAGVDGDSVVDVLARLTVPSIVVLHTVLVTPTEHQRAVLEAVARYADVLVTMTDTARQRLVDHYGVDISKIVVIPHGAHDACHDRPRRQGDPPLLLTWGLLGPGKGIERVIDALPSLRDLDPRPHYLVVGETHPRVLEHDGEEYRNSLIGRAERLGVADMVTFEAGYLDVASLGSVIAAADVVILPYDSREQVTSGVLIEAVTA
ncbi:MAG: glycosyltransferase, partial [Actinomycetota bacterium]|nr:glycosyltransferase [Actinomycetota bacterium]